MTKQTQAARDAYYQALDNAALDAHDAYRAALESAREARAVLARNDVAAALDAYRAALAAREAARAEDRDEVGE